VKALSEQTLRGNIRIFEEWLIPAWGNNEASKNAKGSVKRWKAELRRRGLPIRKQIKLNGLLEKIIEMQKKATASATRKKR